MIKKLSTALYADENILYLNEDSGNIVFSCNEIGILNIDLHNINLGNEMGILNIDLNNNLDNNFGEDYPDTTILVRLLIQTT